MFNIDYTSQIFSEDDQFVAVCPELNVSSFGDTLDEARASLAEAVQLFLETCLELGTLRIVLEEAGYHYDSLTSHWMPRQPVQIQRMEMSFA